MRTRTPANGPSPAVAGARAWSAVSYVGPALVVLALAAALRFAYLTAQGVLEYDEGWLIDVARRSAAEWAEGGLKSYSNYKSSHTSWASLLLSLRLFGVSQRSIQYPFALYGVLGVAAVMWLAAIAYGRRTSLLAGLLLAVSPMHVLYSRTVGIESPGATFVLLAYAFLFLSLRGRTGLQGAVGCFLAGMAMGLAVTANYRVFAGCFVPLPMLCVLARPVPRLIGSALAYLAGFLLILLAWDLALRVAFPGSGGYFHAFLFTDYHSFPQSSPSGRNWLSLFQVREPGYYLRALLDLDDPAVLALAAALPVLSWTVWNPVSERRSDHAILIAILGPTLVFFFLILKAPRGFSFIQPVIALAAARSIELIDRSLRRVRPTVLRYLLPAGLAAVAATWGLARSLSPDVLGRSNPFRLAFQQLGKGVRGAQGEPGILVILDQDAPDLYAAETGRRIARVAMGSTLGDIVKAVDRGYRYWLVDGQFSVYGSSLGYVWPAFDGLTPQRLIPAPTYIRLDHFVEHTVYMHDSYAEETRRYKAWVDRWGRNLPVYDLGQLVAPLAWRGSSAGWYRVGTGIVATSRGEGSANKPRVVWDDARCADFVEAIIAIDYNRLPFEGGLVLRSEDGAGIVLYLDLKRTEGTASIVPLTSEGFLGAAAASYKIPPFEQARSLGLSSSGGRVRAFLNGREILSPDRTLPNGRTLGGLVAPARGGFDVVRYRSEGCRGDRAKEAASGS